MSEVSLCVIRFEECIKSTGEVIKKESDVQISSANLLVRGLRQVHEIQTETYVPSLVVGNPSTKDMDESTGGASSDSLETINFVSGNPFVEVTKGVIHLFKENDLTDIENAAARSQTVCILSVPSLMCCQDLLSFTAAYHSELKHVRIVKGSSPNTYMALLTFRTPQAVENFYRSFNGIPFNYLEPEWCCHLVFVSKIETLSETEGGGMAPASHTELPTCSVCLERMDESVDGILTIMCNHSFHGNCLGKWGDSSCPVCRYVQTPEPTDESMCVECKARESLWICLICGHIGCGRYVHGHAYQHYVDTHHCYSMQLGSNRVWDYVGDNFVHRLLQNQDDGKLVQSSNCQEKSEKASSEQLEYTYLLTSQLESQRLYYENVINTIELNSTKENSALRDQLDKTNDENKILKKSLDTITKDKNTLEKKVNVLSSKLSQALKSLQEEKEMNAAMTKNLTSLTEDFNQYKKEKNEELSEVKEQLRDVMFFLEAEKTLSKHENQDEIKQGHIEIAPAPTTSKPPNRRRKK